VDWLKNGAMEEDGGFFFRVWCLTEVIDVAIWAQAADNFRTWGRIKGKALRTDGDFAVVADADFSLLAPNEGPPGTGRNRAQDGAFLREGLLFGGVRGSAQFTMGFLLVDVGQQLIQEAVGACQFADAICGQQGWEAFLPVIMAAFDFTFGLGRWGVAQGHAVKVQRRAELGEGLWGVGEEEGVVVHVEGQGQAMGLEGAGQEVEVRQEGFGVVEAGPDIVTRGVIQKIKQDLLVVRIGEEGMWGGIILPEGTQVANLPAFDGLGWGLVAGVRGELVGQGPAANTGPVSFEVEAAMQFAGGGAVGGGRFGGEEFGQQLNHRRRPLGLVIAAGATGRPDRRLALRAGPQVLAVEIIKTGAGKTQFPGRLGGGELLLAIAGQEVADERSGQTFDQL
jgi:hypothetical protein